MVKFGHKWLTGLMVLWTAVMLACCIAIGGKPVQDTCEEKSPAVSVSSIGSAYKDCYGEYSACQTIRNSQGALREDGTRRPQVRAPRILHPQGNQLASKCKNGIWGSGHGLCDRMLACLGYGTPPSHSLFSYLHLRDYYVFALRKIVI